MSAAPLISIVTPSLNRAAYIGASVRSVLAQHDGAFEHIIVDGGSTDETPRILADFPHLRIHSGSDSGMYDALNRGIALAQGEILGFLNSDDLYEAGCLANVRAHLCGPFQALAGAAVFFTGDGDAPRITYRSSPHDGATLVRATLGSPSFNAWFFRREVFTRLGVFDAAYRIAGDREFMLRFALSRIAHATTTDVLYRYRQHPGSITMGAKSSAEQMLEEHIRMSDRYLGDANLAADARAMLSEARTRDTLTGVARALRARRLADGLRLARAGIRYDPAWGWKLASRALRAAARSVGLTPAGAR